MLNKLVIKEFQNHGRSELSFHEGLNVIRGASDNGKSAVIRAIRWLVENKPSGDGFRKTDGEGNDTSVQGIFGEHVLGRTKGKKNIYVLDGQEYKAVGTGVPKEISDVIDFNDTNLQSQFSPHFLLSESSGEVAKKLNDIVGLSDIDLAQKIIRRKITELRSEIKFGEGELEKAKSKYDGLLPIISIDEVLSSLEKTNQSIEEQKELVESLSSLIGKIKVINNKIEPLKELISFGEKVDQLLELADDLDQNLVANSKLYASILKIKKIEKQLGDITIPVDQESLDGLIRTGTSLSLDEIEITTLTVLISKLKKATKQFFHAVADDQEQYKLYQKELKRVGQCPLCGGKL